jgi:hypothetical protein
LKHKPLAAFTEAHLNPGIATLALELGDNALTKDLMYDASAEINTFRRWLSQRAARK